MTTTEPSVDLAAPGDPRDLLTAQERACLRLVAQRLSSKEIAAELGIAKTSVDTYCDRARRKLGAPDRYAAARLVAAGEPGASPPASPVTLRRRAGVLAAIASVFAASVGVAALLAAAAALETMKPPTWPDGP